MKVFKVSMKVQNMYFKILNIINKVWNKRLTKSFQQNKRN